MIKTMTKTHAKTNTKTKTRPDLSIRKSSCIHKLSYSKLLYIYIDKDTDKDKENGGDARGMMQQGRCTGVDAPRMMHWG